MIELKKGDILKQDVEALVNTVNCVGVMGKGIALEEQPRIFQRFYRLERDMNSPIRGSGLGLYISRRLTEAMGGKIWVESSGIAGEGSTFHIQLPSFP